MQADPLQNKPVTCSLLNLSILNWYYLNEQSKCILQNTVLRVCIWLIGVFPEAVFNPLPEKLKIKYLVRIFWIAGMCFACLIN